MPDFSGLGARVDNFLFTKPYHEVIFDTPILLTPTTTAVPIVTARGYKWILSFILRVRSLGTATYIRIGDQTYQGYTLNIVGQSIGWDANPGEVMDISKIWVVSDTSDAVCELIVAYLPLHLIGDVEFAVGNQ